MYSEKNSIFKRLTAIVTALLLCVTVIFGVMPEKSVYADGDDVTMDDLRRSVDAVSKSVENLTDIMKPEEQSAIMSIFSGMASAMSSINMVTGFINGNIAFLKLIGVMKDGNAEALANILKQLEIINERLGVMDKKLDDISRQMSEMQAASEFNARGIKANQMISEWNKFSKDYMEDKMDECMRLYDNKLMDGMKAWTEYKTETARNDDPDEVITNKVVLLYNIKKDLRPDMDFHDAYEMVSTYANFIEWQKSRKDVEYPDPYTLYDEDIDTSKQRFIIMDSTFLPEKGEISWNLDTYKKRISEGILSRLLAWKEEARKGQPDWSHIDTKGISVYELPDNQLKEIADDAADEVVYRVVTYEINRSSDFSTRVYKEFGEYCDHLQNAAQGVDAMMKAIYLTNAFEYQAAEDIKAFCNQMILKTGVYGLFTMNVLGASRYITDRQKEDAAQDFCNAVDKVQNTLDSGITGQGNYCYVTNSVLNYGEVRFSGHIDLKYSTRGHYASYDTVSSAEIKTSFDVDDLITPPTPIGDTNALIVAQFVRMAGGVFDHDYMNEHLTRHKREKRSAIITNLSGEQTLPIDSSCKLRVRKCIGNYFPDGAEIYLNNMPDSDAEIEDLVYRKMIQGSTYDANSGLAVNKPLFGMAAYGESHWYWEKDEAAVMGGPCDCSTFKEAWYDENTDVSIILDEYYTRHYDTSTMYNCLLQSPTNQIYSKDSPLCGLAEINAVLEAKTMLVKLAESAEKTIKAGGWEKESLAKFRAKVDEAWKLINSDDAAADDYSLEFNRLLDAWYDLKAVDKKDQSLTVKASGRTLKAGALRKSKKVVKALKVKGSKGKVTYSISKVQKSKYKKYFAVNAKNGRITVKKGLGKGTYKVTVKVKAKGNSSYNPAVKSATVKIKVK